MRIWYFKETEKLDNILKKILLHLKFFFGIIKIKEINNKTVCILPITKDTKLTNRKIFKLLKKTDRFLYKCEVKHIVLSEYLNTIEILKNKLCSENVILLDGRLLFNYLIHDILKYTTQNKLETLEVSLLVNNNTDLVTENIKLISKDIKKLNIITNNISPFKKLETYLYENFGILLNLTNNKKRSLLKSNVIVNLDFSNDLINKYNLSDNCIIININGNINITSKRFGRH